MIRSRASWNSDVMSTSSEEPPPVGSGRPSSTIRRISWIRHLTRERGVNLAGVRILFELEERLGTRILEALYAEGTGNGAKPRSRARGEPSEERRAASDEATE